MNKWDHKITTLLQNYLQKEATRKDISNFFDKYYDQAISDRENISSAAQNLLGFFCSIEIRDRHKANNPYTIQDHDIQEYLHILNGIDDPPGLTFQNIRSNLDELGRFDLVGEFDTSLEALENEGIRFYTILQEAQYPLTQAIFKFHESYHCIYSDYPYNPFLLHIKDPAPEKTDRFFAFFNKRVTRRATS